MVCTETTLVYFLLTHYKNKFTCFEGMCDSGIIPIFLCDRVALSRYVFFFMCHVSYTSLKTACQSKEVRLLRVLGLVCILIYMD